MPYVFREFHAMRSNCAVFTTILCHCASAHSHRNCFKSSERWSPIESACGRNCRSFSFVCTAEPERWICWARSRWHCRGTLYAVFRDRAAPSRSGWHPPLLPPLWCIHPESRWSQSATGSQPSNNNTISMLFYHSFYFITDLWPCSYCCNWLLGMTDFLATTSWGHQWAQRSTRNQTTVQKTISRINTRV